MLLTVAVLERLLLTLVVIVIVTLSPGFRSPRFTVTEWIDLEAEPWFIVTLRTSIYEGKASVSTADSAGAVPGFLILIVKVRVWLTRAEEGETEAEMVGFGVMVPV
jgi:hypothetical protein